jgi:argininosuccinate synthase
VRLKLYKGNVIVVGRDSKTDSLFDPTIATFEDDAGAYDQKDAAGFIKLNALRMRITWSRTTGRARIPASCPHLPGGSGGW